MAKEGKEIVAVNLVIDKDRDSLLNYVFQIAMEDKRKFRKVIDTVGSDVVRDFVQEMSENSHKAGWCRDPKCSHDEEGNKE